MVHTRTFFKKILCLSLGLIFLSACQNEYLDYHSRESQNKATIEKIQSGAWTPDQVSDIPVRLLTSPEKTTLDALISAIQSAKKSVFLEVYMLSEKRVISALREAKTRGVDVQVILEPNPYGNTSINRKAFSTLSKDGIQMTWSDDNRFVFTHAKFFLIDDTYWIMTANMTHSAFVTNREFYAIGSDPEIRATLGAIFEADSRHETLIRSHPSLVVAPYDARTKLETLTKSAKKSIIIYAENFGDASFLSILRGKVEKNISVDIILTDPKKVSGNTEAIANLKQASISVWTPKKPTMHAKSIIVDESIAYVGSINYSTNSMEKNREIGIIIRDTQAIQVLLQTAKQDMQK